MLYRQNRRTPEVHVFVMVVVVVVVLIVVIVGGWGARLATALTSNLGSNSGTVPLMVMAFCIQGHSEKKKNKKKKNHTVKWKWTCELGKANNNKQHNCVIQ